MTTEPVIAGLEALHDVTVYRYGRDNEKIAYSAKARYSEYVQTKKDGLPNHMWATKPYIMLGKCAEALALRKAFPDELSGMYADEEMGQADNDQPGAPAAKPQVQMPRSTDEKKQEPPKAAPQSGKAETVKQTPMLKDTLETVTSILTSQQSAPARNGAATFLGNAAGAAFVFVLAWAYSQCSTGLLTKHAPANTPPPAVASPSGTSR